MLSASLTFPAEKETNPSSGEEVWKSCIALILWNELDEPGADNKIFGEIIGGMVFPTPHLLVWDKFPCHIREATKTPEAAETGVCRRPRWLHKICAGTWCVLECSIQEQDQATLR